MILDLHRQGLSVAAIASVVCQRRVRVIVGGRLCIEVANEHHSVWGPVRRGGGGGGRRGETADRREWKAQNSGKGWYWRNRCKNCLSTAVPVAALRRRDHSVGGRFAGTAATALSRARENDERARRRGRPHDGVPLVRSATRRSSRSVRPWYRSRLSFSWRVDATYVRVKGRWKYLYRAIDKDGATLDFYLATGATPRRQSGFWPRHCGAAATGRRGSSTPTRTRPTARRSPS